MFTKIFDIVDNYKQDLNEPKRFFDFKSNFNPSYSKWDNYFNGEHLEFGLRYDKKATQISYPHAFYPKYPWYPHDAIFDVAPNILIDFKKFNKKYNGITVSIKNKLKQYELGQVTHYGIWDCKEINERVYVYKLMKLLSFKEVWDNLESRGQDDKFMAYTIN